MIGNPKLAYGTMLKTRVSLITPVRFTLHKALLIAIRYSIVRRQFRNISGKKEETQLIDYQTQQMKLFPLLAAAFAYAFGALYTAKINEELEKDMQKDDFSKLELMHHLTTG